MLFLQASESPTTGPPSALLSPADPSQGSYEQMSTDEVLCFGTNCPECNAPANTNMKLTSESLSHV